MLVLAIVCGRGFEKSALYSGCAAEPPQHACQAQHQLAFHGRFRVVIGNHCSFEGLVILCILERCDDGLGGEAVATGSSPN